ncbi:MAG: putative delta-60 repeat protein [Phenylobacterium sp.]|jgi:uncharacterized delta-60 repeat protein
MTNKNNTHKTNTSTYKAKLSKTLCFALSTFAISAQGAETPTPGELDPTFGNNGLVTTNIKLANYGLTPVANAIDKNGNTVVVGQALNSTNDIFIARINAAGELDSQFGHNGISIIDLASNDTVSAVVIDSNNQPLIRVHSDDIDSLRRYTTSGVLDTDFGTNGIVVIASNAQQAIDIDSQDRILIETTVDSNTYLTRLLATGTVDTDFAEAGSLLISGINNIKMTLDNADNLFVVGNGSTTIELTKYQSNGQIDSNFAFETDGRVTVFCCNSPEPVGIALDSQGNIAVAVDAIPNVIGDPSENPWSARIYRFTPAGIGDSSFAQDAELIVQYESSGRPLSFAIDSSDHLWLSSRLFDFKGPVTNDVPRGHAIYRYNPQGVLDSTFSDDGILPVTAALTTSLAGSLLMDDQQLSVLMSGDELEPLVSRFDLNGQLTRKTAIASPTDKTLNTVSSTLALSPQGQILITGAVDVTPPNYSWQTIPFIAQFSPQGQADLNYGQSNGQSNGINTALHMGDIKTIDSDGNYLVLSINNHAIFDDFGEHTFLVDATVTRYEQSGEVDSSFGHNGVIEQRLESQPTKYNTSIAIASDGKILLAVADTLFRYNASGQTDTGFGANGSVNYGFAGSVTVKPQRSGDIFVVGDTSTWLSRLGEYFDGKIKLVKYDKNGVLSSDFGSSTPGQVTTDLDGIASQVYAMAIDPQGRIVLVGQKDINDSRSTIVLRYLANGQLDSSFGTDGVTVTAMTDNFAARHIIVDSNGAIIVSGSSDSQVVALRYTNNGVLDPSFSQDGIAPVSQNDDLRHQSGMVLDDNGYLYLSTNTGQNAGLLKMYSGYPALESPHAVSVTFTGNVSRAITTSEFGFTETLIDISQITLLSVPADGQLFIDSNSNSVQDDNEASLNIGDVISKVQLDAGQLFYTPGLSSLSTFEYSIDEQTTSQSLRLVVNLSPQATITASVSDITTNSSIPVTIDFTESVNGFSAEQFTVTNATMVGFNGDGQTYTLTLTATDLGQVSLNIPEGAATDDSGISNLAASWSVIYTDQILSVSGTPATSTNEDSPYSFTPTVESGDNVTFSIVNKPNWANFDNTTGSLTGTPDNEHIGTTPAIVISMSDALTTTSLAPFDLEVLNVNDAPLISGTPATSVNEDQSYSFTPTASDVDANSTLAFSISNKPSWASFDTATGMLSGIASNDDVGTTTGIVISVGDGEITTNLASFDLEVVNTNDAPIISGTPITAIDEGQSYRFTPTASDMDSDDTLTFSITNKPTWASFDTAAGILSGTPLNDNVGITTDIVISVSDNEISTSLASFDLEVINVNGALSLSGSPQTSVNQDQPFTFTPTTNNEDLNETVSFSINNKPDWASFDQTTGTLSGIPGNANIGTTQGIVITVSDGETSASLEAFNLEVVNVNDAPVISGTPTTSVNEGQSYSFTPTATDIDANETFSFNITNKPDWLSFNSTTGALTGTPSNADVGNTAAIVISVTDGDAIVSLPPFSLTVVNINDAPILTGIPATSVNEDQPYSFTPTAIDIDVNDNLSFSISNKPDWASFDTTEGTLSGTPLNADVGTTTDIVISVTDGLVTSAGAPFNLEVLNTNDAPQISGIATTLVVQGEQYSFTPQASDDDIADTLSFSIVNKPDWITFDNLTGALTGTPVAADVGSYDDIVISVSDSALATASIEPFSIKVDPVAPPPPPPITPPTTQSSGGGGLGFSLFLLMVLGTVRRWFGR